MTTKRIDIILHGKNELNRALSSASNDVKNFKRDISNNLKDRDVSGAFDTIKKNATAAGAAMVAAGAAIIAAWGMVITTTIQAAAASEQNWGRFTVAIGRTGMEIEKTRNEYGGMVDKIVSETGRLKGDTISTMGTLSRVGITSKDTLKDSTESIAALSFLTQDEMGNISEGYSKLVGRSKIMEKSLMSIGIRGNVFNEVLKKNNLTMEDWSKLTENQRANLLNQAVAMQNGSAANEEYKDSYEGLMNQINQQFLTLKTTIGQALLPTVKSILEDIIPIAKGFVDWFKSLDDGQKKIVVLTPLVTGLAVSIGGIAIAIWGNIAAIRTWNSTPMASKTATVTTGGTGAGGLVSQLLPVVAALPLLGFAMGAGGEASKGSKPEDILAGGASGFFGGMLGDKNKAKESGEIFTNDAIASRQRLIDAFNNSANIFTNDAQDTSKWLRDGISGLTKNFNKSGNIFTKDATNSGKIIQNKIKNSIRGVMDFGSWAVKGAGLIARKLSKIYGSFNIGSLGVKGLTWLSQRLNITGSLNLSAWNNYAKRAIDAASRSNKGPAGPGSSFIGHASGFTYQGYGGVGQSIATTLSTGSGNCVDGTLAQMALANQFGIPSEMIATTWHGNPHVYARIGGQNRDIANHALTGSWNPPPRGPGGNSGMIVIYGDVYGYNDFVRKVEQANNKLCRG